MEKSIPEIEVLTLDDKTQASDDESRKSDDEPQTSDDKSQTSASREEMASVAKLQLGWWQQFVSTLKTWYNALLTKVANMFKLIPNRAPSRRASRRLTQAQRKLLWMKLLRFGAIGMLAAVVLGMMAFFALFVYYSSQLPKPGEIVRRSGFSTKIFARNGELLYDLYDQERRTPIKIDQAPEHLKQATIAIEDKDFYNHEGFDMLTILRIPYNAIVKQRVVGGSTLTQQLVKNVFLTNERSVTRKFKELVLSLQIERTFSKDQILEMYLNEAPYGGTAWGVGTAAEMYFDKPIQELTVTEAAILAGLPQRPSAYSPFTGKTDEEGVPLWKVRTLGVLRRMKEDGYISDLGYEEAIKELDQIVFNTSGVNIVAPHFVFYVRDLLAEQYGEDVVETAGFKVTTSLDLDLQKEAETVVAEEIEKVESLNITNGAVVVMQPQTGEIMVMVGSKDFNSEEIDGQFNVAVDGLRQPGSSIKPVTYLALLQRGYTPSSMLMDVSTVFQATANDKPYQPKNYDGIFRGPVNVRNSLGSSLNVPAVKALALVGIDNFLDQAYKMGFVTLEPTRENMQRFGLAVTLGGAEVHLLDTATAYSSFANGGYKVEPVAILKIEDRDGRVIYEHKPVQGNRVMTDGEAFLINNILSDNSARAMAFGTNSLLNVNQHVAVKTGTTNDQRDNWAVGWSQDVLVGAWVGNNDNSAMKQVASGVSGATPIWRRIILAALDRDEYGAPPFEMPDSVEQVQVDAISGYPAHDDFPARTDFAIKGTLPALPDPIHTKLKLCRGEDKLANDARVAAGDYEEKEFVVIRVQDPVNQEGKNLWQDAINEWIGQNEDRRFHPPNEYCGEDDEIYLKMKRPENEKKYEYEDIEVEIEADSSDGIKKIEVWVDDKLMETINSNRYKGKIKMPAGQHEVYAKVETRDGHTKRTDKVKIGTGGEDWKKPDPTPTPKPTPSPTPTPTPTPSTGEDQEDENG